jgi:hypothetical protein
LTRARMSAPVPARVEVVPAGARFECVGKGAGKPPSPPVW